MVTINAQQLSTGWAVTVSCLSGDDKPSLFHPPGIFSAGLVPMPNGAKLRELDTGKTYRFDADSAAWFPQPAAQDEAAGLGLTGASVGDLVRVNAVDANGTPTSWEHVPLNEIKCNKNLLDNWYFVGGGSQLGDGVFPINQRGQATYSGTVYGIDRWYGYQSAVNISITSDGINITRSASESDSLIQKINNPESLRGKKVTASLLATGYNRIRIRANNVSIAISPNNKSGNELNSITAVIPNDTTELSVCIYTVSNISTVAKAVKLELGSEQTLAHNEGTEENPVWVLNEVPDFGEELRKCQRYFYRYKPGRICTIANGYYQSETSFAFNGSLGAPLKSVANASINGNLYAGSVGHIGANSMVVTNVGELIMLPNGQISGNATTDATTRGNAMILQIRDGTTYIDFSCEP